MLNGRRRWNGPHGVDCECECECKAQGWQVQDAMQVEVQCNPCARDNAARLGISTPQACSGFLAAPTACSALAYLN